MGVLDEGEGVFVGLFIGFGRGVGFGYDVGDGDVYIGDERRL